MKYIKQFTIILAITFIGEGLNHWIPLPIPGSIYGMILLYVSLYFGMIKLSWIKETGKFLIDIMPMMFIPAGVGLMDSWGILQPVWVPFFVITCISTVAVMAVSGKVTQCLVKPSLEDEEEKINGKKEGKL